MSGSALVFPVGMDQYAIPAGLVREVVTNVRPTRLPTAPDVLIGVFNLRGEVVPMFDTAAMLGFGMLQGADVAIVVTLQAGPAGFMVGALPSIHMLGQSIGPSELRGTLGTYDSRDGIAVLLDVEQLILPHTNLTMAHSHDSVSVQ